MKRIEDSDSFSNADVDADADADADTDADSCDDAKMTTYGKSQLNEECDSKEKIPLFFLHS